MPTLTIRNVPVEVVDRLKFVAARNGRSMEQEVRDLLAERYAIKAEILARIRERWDKYPPVDPKELEAWRRTGRE